MSDSWFDPSLIAWIPGTLFGMLAGCFGGLAGPMAARGKGKALILGLWWAFLAVAVMFLSISLFAFLTGQPYGIWYGFGLPGLLGVILFPALLPSLLKQYTYAEQRRMQSKDLI